MTCVKGSVYDVVVDLRCESPTYLKWAAVVLSDSNGLQLLVPPFCGHGYYSLQEGSTVLYVQVCITCLDKVATHLEIRELRLMKKSGKFIKNCQIHGKVREFFLQNFNVLENVGIAHFIAIFFKW